MKSYVLSVATLACLLWACNNDKPIAVNPDEASALRPFQGLNMPPISNFDTPPKEAKK